MCVCVCVKRYQWFSLFNPGLQSPSSSLLLLLLSSRSSFLDLEDEQAQVDVLGGQQLVALHRVGDGQRDVVRLVGVVAEGVVVDDRLDPHVVVRTLQQQEGALQGGVHLRSHTHTHKLKVFLTTNCLRHSINEGKVFLLF